VYKKNTSAVTTHNMKNANERHGDDDVSLDDLHARALNEQTVRFRRSVSMKCLVMPRYFISFLYKSCCVHLQEHALALLILGYLTSHTIPRSIEFERTFLKIQRFPGHQKAPHRSPQK
jgi:hypothetical protein